MPWKLDLRAQLPSQRKAEREQRRASRGITVSLLLLGALFAVVYTRRGPAIASLPASLSFGVLPVQSAGTEQILAVRNEGNASLNVRDAVVAGNHSGDFQVTENGCSAGPTLPNQTCQITLRFQPSAGGERRATLILADDANDSPQSVPLTGTGTERVDLTIAPMALTFADQTAGVVSDGQPVTLTNTSDEPVTVSDIALSDETNSFEIDSALCRGATIAVGQSCTVTIRFKPLDTGNRTARLVIRDSSGDDSHQVPISGNGTVTPSAGVRLTPAPLDFGKQEVGKTAVGIVTIASTGKTSLKTDQVQISGEGVSEFVAENKCADSELAPGTDCRLQVRFTPKSQGQHVARLSIGNNAGSGPQEIALIGYGVLPPPPPRDARGLPPAGHTEQPAGGGTGPISPAVPLAPQVLAHPEECRFGSQELRISSPAQRLTLTSVGTAPAHVQGFSVEGQFSQDFSINDVNCRGRSLAPRDECSLNVAFVPQSPMMGSSQPGRSAVLVIPITGGSPVRVALTGTAIAAPRPAQPGFTTNPAEVAFGEVQVGVQSPSRSITLSNPGSDPIQLRASMPAAGRGDFRVLGGDCRNNAIPAHGSCIIILAFSPQGAGTVQSQLTLASDSPVQLQAVRLSGIGLPKSVATGFTVVPNLVDFGRVQVGAQTEGRPIVLGNPNPDPIQLRVGSVQGGNGGAFRFFPGNCQNNTIPAHGNCTISLAFAPKDAGNRQAELTLASKSQVQSVRLSGIGVSTATPPPAMTGFIVSPGEVDFGRTALGTQTQGRPITLTNPGTVPVQIRASLAGGNGGDFRQVGSSCPNLTIPPRGSCVISAAFVPQQSGNRQAVMTLTSRSQTQSVRLSGVALPKSSPPVEQGWCCVPAAPPNYARSGASQKGTPTVRQSTQEDCARMRGAYYKDYRLAKARCGPAVGQLDWEERLRDGMIESMLDWGH
jgi:hypothetical protein